MNDCVYSHTLNIMQPQFGLLFWALLLAFAAFLLVRWLYRLGKKK